MHLAVFLLRERVWFLKPAPDPGRLCENGSTRSSNLTVETEKPGTRATVKRKKTRTPDGLYPNQRRFPRFCNRHQWSPHQSRPAPAGRIRRHAQQPCPRLPRRNRLRRHARRGPHIVLRKPPSSPPLHRHNRLSQPLGPHRSRLPQHMEARAGKPRHRLHSAWCRSPIRPPRSHPRPRQIRAPLRPHPRPL